MTDPRIATAPPVDREIATRDDFLAAARERSADPAGVACLERLEPHVIATAISIAEHDDYRGILNAVLELVFAGSVRAKRQADEAAARCKAAEAELRRHTRHLSLVPASPAATTNKGA